MSRSLDAQKTNSRMEVFHLLTEHNAYARSFPRIWKEDEAPATANGPSGAPQRDGKIKEQRMPDPPGDLIGRAEEKICYAAEMAGFERILFAPLERIFVERSPNGQETIYVPNLALEGVALWHGASHWNRKGEGHEPVLNGCEQELVAAFKLLKDGKEWTKNAQALRIHEAAFALGVLGGGAKFLVGTPRLDCDMLIDGLEGLQEHAGPIEAHAKKVCDALTEFYGQKKG